MWSFHRHTQRPPVPRPGRAAAMARPSPVASSAEKAVLRHIGRAAALAERGAQVALEHRSHAHRDHRRRPWAAAWRHSAQSPTAYTCGCDTERSIGSTADEAALADRQPAAACGVALPGVGLGAGGPQHQVAVLAALRSAPGAAQLRASTPARTSAALRRAHRAGRQAGQQCRGRVSPGGPCTWRPTDARTQPSQHGQQRLHTGRAPTHRGDSQAVEAVARGATVLQARCSQAARSDPSGRRLSTRGAGHLPADSASSPRSTTAGRSPARRRRP